MFSDGGKYLLVFLSADLQFFSATKNPTTEP
jgi:hypothetical protein